MYRRRLLAGAGLSLASSITGCLASESGNDTNPTDSAENAERHSSTPSVEDTVDCGDRLVETWHRSDLPPYPIEAQPEIESSDEADAWDPHYLGKHMPATPSRPFNPVNYAFLNTSELYPDEYDGDGFSGMPSYFVDLIATDEAFENAFDTEALREADDEIFEQFPIEDAIRPTEVDFDESILVFVKAGHGGSSSRHRWVRVEETGDGLHLHGYRTVPYMGLQNLGPHLSMVEVERPNYEVRTVRVSYTEDECQRMHFSSEEGGVDPLTAGFTNETDEPVTADVTITAGDGDRRVGREITIAERDSEHATENGYRHLGFVADDDESLSVSVAIDRLGIDRTASADANEAETVDMQLSDDEGLSIDFQST